jgi:hypothetical protein
MSPLQVTVAALGSPFPFVFAAPWDEDDAGQAVAYDRRPQTSAEVSPEISLREALGVAARALGACLSDSPDARGLRERYGQSAQLKEHLVYADFYRPTDSDGLTPRRPLIRTALVDDHGRARWGIALDQSLGELIRASSAKVLKGDPLRPYLILSIPQGDPGFGGEWNQFVEGLRLAWDIVKPLGEAYASFQALKAIKARLSKGASVIEHDAPRWTSRDGGPHDVANLMTSRRWTTAEATKLLGCPCSDTEFVMLALGCAFDEETGTWDRSTDDASRFMVAVRQIAFADILAPGDTKASMIEQLADEARLHDRVSEIDWIAVQRQAASEILEDLGPDDQAPDE